MSITFANPVTGGPQSGFTSPTYTGVVDQPPANNAKQIYISAAGGTQVGVTVHTVASPFTITFWRPVNLKTLPRIGVNGQYGSVPKNDYRCIVRKGVTPASGQPAEIAMGDCRFSIPAGAETFDAPNVRAMISALVGILTQQSSGLGDTLTTGSLG